MSLDAKSLITSIICLLIAFAGFMKGYGMIGKKEAKKKFKGEEKEVEP